MSADKSNVSSNIKLSLPEFDGDNWDEFKLAFTSAIGMNGWEDHLADDHATHDDDAKIQKQIYWLLGIVMEAPGRLRRRGEWPDWTPQWTPSPDWRWI